MGAYFAAVNDEREFDGAQGAWPRPLGDVVVGTQQIAGHADEYEYRRLPLQYMQSIEQDATSLAGNRVQHCIKAFLCTCCGCEIAHTPDGLGWLYAETQNAGGATCTRCCWLALNSCPHLMPYREQDPLEAWMWIVTSADGYRQRWNSPSFVDGSPDSPHCRGASLAELREAMIALRSLPASDAPSPPPAPPAPDPDEEMEAESTDDGEMCWELAI